MNWQPVPGKPRQLEGVSGRRSYRLMQYHSGMFMIVRYKDKVQENIFLPDSLQFVTPEQQKQRCLEWAEQDALAPCKSPYESKRRR